MYLTFCGHCESWVIDCLLKLVDSINTLAVGAGIGRGRGRGRGAGGRINNAIGRDNVTDCGDQLCVLRSWNYSTKFNALAARLTLPASW